MALATFMSIKKKTFPNLCSEENKKKRLRCWLFHLSLGDGHVAELSEHGAQCYMRADWDIYQVTHFRKYQKDLSYILPTMFLLHWYQQEVQQ